MTYFFSIFVYVISHNIFTLWKEKGGNAITILQITKSIYMRVKWNVNNLKFKNEVQELKLFVYFLCVYMYSSKMFYSSLSLCFLRKRKKNTKKTKESKMLIPHDQFLKDTHLLDYELL